MTCKYLSGQSILVIATTVPSVDGDGIPPFVTDLATEMAALGASVRVLAPSIQGRTAPSVFRNDVQIVRFRYFLRRYETLGGAAIVPALRRSPYLLVEATALVVGMAVALARECLRQDPDWVHAHWTIPTGLLTVISRTLLRRRHKILVTSHGADVFALNGPVWRLLRKWTVESANLVLPTSSELASRLGINSCFAVPMGADSTIFSPPSQATNRRRYLFVGRLEEKKGILVLLEAISKVHHVGLDVVGSGPLEAEMLAKIKELGISDRVVLKGARGKRDISQYMQTARALVVPSVRASDGDTESGPVVVFEAILSNCPIIATDVGEVPTRWLEDGVTARVVPSGSPAKLAEAIYDLESHPILRDRLATRALLDLEKFASMAATARQYAAAIENVECPKN